MKTLDVVTFGETMVLFTGADALPFEYVHQFDKQLGGAESNLAVGLQRLGHSVGWFSKLGNDPFGRYIHRFIRGEGVDTSSCLYTDEAPTGVFFKEKLSKKQLNIYYYRQHSAASLLRTEDLNEEYIANAKVLHVTGITPALSDSCREAVFKAIDMAKHNGLFIVFDPNIRFKLWESFEEARKVMLDIAGDADVILPGLDEGEFLTGKGTPEEIADFFLQGKNKTVIVKLGARGSYYQTDTDSGYVEGFPVQEVVDPVGAGDGFAAGVINGILRHQLLEQTLKQANAIGAIVVGMKGDVEGLPALEQVNSFLANEDNGQDVVR